MSQSELTYALRDARRRGDFALEARLACLLAAYNAKK